MELFETILLILLVLICGSLGALVLIQQSRGSDIGAAFGSGAANTIFGSTGATPFLVKLTAIMAISFFAITFGLAFSANEKAKSTGQYDFGDLPETTTDDELLDFDLTMPLEEVTDSTDESDSQDTTDQGDQPPIEPENGSHDDAGDELPRLDEVEETPTEASDPNAGDELPEI